MTAVRTPVRRGAPPVSPSPRPTAHEIERPDERVRLYVWQVPVRVTHWVTAGCIVVLSLTGGYIADPFLIPPGNDVMSSIRLIHILTALTFLVSGLMRTYWLLAGNRFARWTAFIPTSKFQVTELFRQAGFYGFIRKDIPKVLGHNQLAATRVRRAVRAAARGDRHRLRPRRPDGRGARRDAVRLAARARRAADAAPRPPPRDVGDPRRSRCSTSTAACSWTTSSTTA